jgi:hypothetical protein
MKLLSIGSDAKTSKGEAHGYMTGILYLAPSDVSGVMNTCPWASKGCRLACLYTAGRGAFSNVQKARVNKTLWFDADPQAFMEQLVLDIQELIRKAEKVGKVPCVRLNGTSDIPWESIRIESKGITLFQLFPSLRFYDYTKNPVRMKEFLRSGYWPKNYSLTFSRSENNQSRVDEILRMGGNVAAVYRVVPPESFDRPVISGDDHDLRFLDPNGVVVGLKAKGKAKTDLSGFVL